MNYKNLENQLAYGNKEKAIQIAEAIVNKNYKAHLGANGHDTYIDLANKGGLINLNGLMVGDKVLMINNVAVKSEKEVVIQLSKLIKQYGETVIYKIERQGRIIDIEAKLIYPEVESAKRILADLKSNKTNSYQHIARIDTQKPWIKILEPKNVRGVRIISNQRVSFVILTSGINKIKSLTVNGLECDSVEADQLDKTLLAEPDNLKKYAIRLPLQQGKNNFVITATDTKGNKEEKNIEIEGNQSFSKEIGQKYDRRIGVVIGIDKYLDPEYDSLDFAIKDAQSVKEQIEKMGFDKVFYVPEDDATRIGILRVLTDDLPKLLNQNDALFVYFAGHGDTEDLGNGNLEGYLLPKDAKKQNYRGTAISMEKIREAIDNYKSKHILFILDSCHSGYATKPQSLKQTSFKRDVVQIITSTGKDEKAREDHTIGHGIFTNAFLDSLQNNELYSADGIILASDIYNYVNKKVKQQTGNSQHPQHIKIDGDGDFKFEKL